MSARQDKWVMVRLKRQTHAQLRALGAKWFALYSDGRPAPAPNDRGEISLDDIIQELLSRDNAHRARGRRKPAPDTVVNPEAETMPIE